jgi:drug/metabolite transporter (DMT)-like permease
MPFSPVHGISLRCWAETWRWRWGRGWCGWRILARSAPIPLIALFAWREKSRHPIDRRVALLAVVAGVFFALDLGSWHLGIERTRLGNATLFGNAGSVILMVWGLIALRRAPTGREGLGITAALAGAGILLGRSLEISTQSALGDLFCLFAGVCYAFYLLPAQKARAKIGQWSVLLLVCITAAPLLLLIAIGLGEPVWPGDWTPVVALAISSQIVGQGLLVYSLGHFPPLVIGLALLTQPAIAAAVGWFAFGETLGGLDIVGMVLVGAALLLARTAKAVPIRAR